jgi:hypothetical protein
MLLKLIKPVVLYQSVTCNDLKVVPLHNLVFVNKL